MSPPLGPTGSKELDPLDTVLFSRESPCSLAQGGLIPSLPNHRDVSSEHCVILRLLKHSPQIPFYCFHVLLTHLVSFQPLALPLDFGTMDLLGSSAPSHFWLTSQ